MASSTDQTVTPQHDVVIRARQVDIIFGDNPASALPLLDRRQSRQQIQQQTGQVLGVSDACFDLYEGEILVLMGLSGSGKSTLLRAINGLNPMTRGEIEIRTEGGMVNVAKCGARNLRKLRIDMVAMVFQQFGLLPWRSVAANVGFGLEIARRPKAIIEQKVSENLALVGLADWAQKPVGSLSGGMQQRVGLARAFATDAPILLMDEPFSALDPLIRNRLQDELLDLQRKLRRSIVFVSHDLDEAVKLGNRIAIMDGGKIVQIGTAQQILTHPANQYVADFVSHINPLHILTAATIMKATEGDLPQNTDMMIEPTCPIRHLMAKLDHHAQLFVVENGRIMGIITSDLVVKALAGKYSA